MTLTFDLFDVKIAQQIVRSIIGASKSDTLLRSDTEALQSQQVAQLSQRNRAAGWVSFGPNITGTRYCAPNIVGLGQEAQVTAENACI